MIIVRADDEQAVIRSDDEATCLRDLHHRFYRPLVTYFQKRIREHVDAEDLVQEVFLRLMVRADLSTVEAWDGYVFKTAANVMNDWARRRTTRCHDVHEEFDEERIDGDERSPERVLISSQSLEALLKALGNMPPRTRQVFILRRYEGLSNADIANQLGLSVSGVRFHSVNAKAILARCWGGLE